jgi:aldose 1-epimerase
MKKVLLLSLTVIIVSVLMNSCNQSSKNKEMVKKENFGVHKGKDVFLFTLTNKAGNVLKLTNFGARITWIEVPDRSGNKENVTFGYDTFEGMIKGDPYFGSVVGRYANRVAKGKFTLDGVEYSLPINNGVNSLHGGPEGWHSVVWDAELPSDTEFPTVKFTYKSPDMEAGYPGNMDIEATYTWNDNNEIVINYKCTSDKNTVINITNHAYFNLHGAGNGDILDHQVVINADRFVPVDSGLIPTGELRPVAGTPFDFTTPYTVGARINEQYEQLILGGGYDHTFVLNSPRVVDATVYDPVSGRFMEVISDQPGVQFYTGNFLDGTQIGHDGKKYIYRSGLCLETGHYPDSPNHPEFPSTTLKAGEAFTSQTIYRFSVK